MVERRVPSTTAARLVRLERSMSRLRWFSIAFGAYQVAWYEPNPGTTVPPSAPIIAVTGLLFLVAANIAVIAMLRKPRSHRSLRRFGAWVFGADLVALYITIWAFNFEIYGTTWVLLAVLALEGALRAQLRGAMLPAVAATLVEPFREVFMHLSFGRPFFVTSVLYRVVVVGMVGFVAGIIARDLEQQRSEAEHRATELGELAEREGEARRESNAFQEVILAGVSESDLSGALSSMLSHVATELGYDRSAVLILEKDGRLHVAVTHGFGPSAADVVIDLGQGISGVVAMTGSTEIVPDVSADPRYIRVDPPTRSQITVPIVRGDNIIGVLNVESDQLDAFDATDAARLKRLAAQMALVIEQARLLAQERATVERLREIDVMKSDFIAIASHELRTPLTAMKGSIRTLLRPEFKSSVQHQTELLEVLDRQTERLARLVEDLLVASRVDAGAISISVETIDLARVLDEVVGDLSPMAGRVTITESGDRPLRSHTDGRLLAHVARNLIENALKFSPPDSIVHVGLRGDDTHATIEVSDDGPGIAPQDLERIFDRFHQAGGLKRRSEGFGLGLYITKRFVEALGGTISVRSAPGRGSTFTVRLPRAEASGAESREANIA